MTFSSFSSPKQSCFRGLQSLSNVNFLCSFFSNQTDWQRVTERICSFHPFLTPLPLHFHLSLILLPLGKEVVLGLIPSPGNAAFLSSKSHPWMMASYQPHRLLAALFSSLEGPLIAADHWIPVATADSFCLYHPLFVTATWARGPGSLFQKLKRFYPYFSAEQ